MAMQQAGQQLGVATATDSFGSPAKVPASSMPEDSSLSRPQSPKTPDAQVSMMAQQTTPAGAPADPSELDTDHFYMYIYKVAPCLKNYTHDWSACPFAHKGEKATRRDPLKYSYMASNCPDHKRGICPRGDDCTFSHGVFESCLHPERYRTQMCNSGANCNRSVCFFAHSTAELRSPYCQNCPSQIDATTVSTLRALLSSSPAAAGVAQHRSDVEPSPRAQQHLHAGNMLRNAMNSLPAGMNPPASNFPAAPQPMAGQSAPGGGDILNQACNLLCALQLLGNKNDTHSVNQASALNALRNHSQQLPQSGSSMFGGLGQLDQVGAEVAGIDWGSLGINDSNLSMLLNSAGVGQLAKPDTGLHHGGQQQGDYGNGIPAYHAPQQNFSYLASS